MLDRMRGPGRWRPAGFALTLSLTLACLSLPVRAESDPNLQHVQVTLDQAKLLKIPDRVETVVVGSPIIADVTMLKKNGLVVVTGKGFGQTNIIFLDKQGSAVSEALVSVQRAPYLLTVQRGTDRESYSCTPRCEPSVTLGDSSKFMQDASGQITSRNGLAGSSH